MKLRQLIVATLFVAVAALSAQAQDKKQDRKKLTADEQSMYVVSAKAGVINIIEGEVSVKSPTGEWQSAIAGEDLLPGAVVKTGAEGRVEILLNPGCFLRLGESSELLYASGNTYNLKLHLLKGSAILEASALDGPIRFKAGNSLFMIAKHGLYRFNGSADGKSEIAVRKGKAMLGKTEIKGGKKAIVDGGAPLIAKLDKKAEDEFDTWSKERARTLIAANKKLSQKVMRQMGLLSSMSSVWIYDSTCGCRTWLPGGFGFSSPYGWSYSRCNPYWSNYYWNYNRNDNGYYSGNPSGGGQAGGAPSGGSSSPGNGGGSGRFGGGGSSRPEGVGPRIDIPSRKGRPDGN